MGFFRKQQKAKQRTERAFIFMIKGFLLGNMKDVRKQIFGMNVDDNVFMAYQLLFEQYLKNFICLRGIGVAEYAMALSPTCGSYVLEMARIKGYIHFYSKAEAKKLRIKNNNFQIGSASSEEDYY